MTNSVVDEDQVLGQLHDIAEEAKSEAAGLQRRAKAGELDTKQLTTAVQNLASILADLAGVSFTAHGDNFNWAKQVDEDLDEIKEELARDETLFLPEDAVRLKSLLLALSQNLRSPLGADDDVPAALKKQVEESILFIDEHTIEIEEEPGAGGGDDDDADPEDEDDKE